MKREKRIKKFCILLLSFCMIYVAGFCSLVNAGATEIENTSTETEMKQVGNIAAANEKIDGIVYESHEANLNKETFLNRIENKDYDDVVVQIELEDKFYESTSYREIQNNKDEYADPYDYLADLRDACNDFYKSKMNDLGCTDLFVQSDFYSCFYDITESVLSSRNPYNELQKYTENEIIENVIVSEKHKDKDEGWFGSFYGETVNTINANESITSNSRAYNGQGIKVGVSEVNMSDVDIDCSNHSNFVLDPTLGSGSNNCTSHAHFVLSAITSMAPNVQIYGSDSTNRGINWLIQQNVSVINCSWGSTTNLGQYCSREKYFDTLALDNEIIFVFSAGNVNSETNPDNELTCPKSAFNIITVGATESNGTTVADYSCYKTDISIGKPNLVANGTPHLLGSGVGNTFHTDSGTSYAAPLVTGALALLQDRGHAFEVYSAQALLAATANINKITNPGNSKYAGFYEKAGAGMLDVDRLLNTFLFNDNWFFNFEESPDKIVKEVNVWMYEGLTMRACAAWFAKPTSGQTAPVVTDYDLRIYNNSTGALVASSSSSTNNMELLTYTAPTEGSYKIQLYMFSSSVTNGSDYGTIAYSQDFEAYNN